jgi:hypothetical protein
MPRMGGAHGDVLTLTSKPITFQGMEYKGELAWERRPRLTADCLTLEQPRSTTSRVWPDRHSCARS